MKNTEDMQVQTNTIQQTVQLSEEEFKSLEYFIGYKADIVYAQPEQAKNDLSFCLSKEDIDLLEEIKPDVIRFVKH